jgi:alkanesulfonate monooxygenase SsuD/methylene tetrahydromethanopterin reductase-like flavin-dependent oxidoreductase (luciferase family)
VCGRGDAEVRRRAAAVGQDPAGLRAGGGLVGTPGQIVEQIQEYAAKGASRVFLQVLDVRDLDHVELIATEVAPHV